MGQGTSSERGRHSARKFLSRRSQSVPSGEVGAVLGSSWRPSREPRFYKAIRKRFLPKGSEGRLPATLGAAKTMGPGSLFCVGGVSGAWKGKAARDHGRVFRDLVAGWSAQDLHCLLVEYEAAAALRELTWRADGARPAYGRLAQDLGRLGESGVGADVELAFQGTLFPAHAPLLKARSAFFRRLLNGAKPHDRIEVKLPAHLAPMKSEDFGLLLHYLYTGEIDTEARIGLGSDIERLLKLKEELGCPNSLERDVERMLEEADNTGDAILIFVANSTSTPIPHDLSLDEAGPSAYESEDEDGAGTLRAGTSAQPAAPVAAEEEAEDGTVSAEEEMAVWRQGLAEMQPSGSRSRPLSLASSSTPQRHAELRCHSALLAARSPFFAALLSRHRRRSDAEPILIHLDESILPRIYAPVLLHALYTDNVDLSKVVRNCPIPINSLSEVQAIASGKCQVQPIDEATEIYHIAQFLEFPALAHGCETTIVEHVSGDCVVGVYNWASEPHGSPFVRRHCVHFLAREFSRIANSSLLFDLEEALLYETLSSDFVQASELEILNAVIKWGEQTLMRRLEEREPNLIATTTHSISRKGLRRSDLSDEELKEILSALMPLVRTDYILPPFHQALVSATARGLLAAPPLDLPPTSTPTTLRRPSPAARSISSPAQGSLRRRLSESGRSSSRRQLSESEEDLKVVVVDGGLGNPDGHWLHPHSTNPRIPRPVHHRRTPRPRFFGPYYREALHQLHKRLQENPDEKLLSHEPPPISTLSEALPDALYMIKPSASRLHAHEDAATAYALEEERLGSSSSEEELDEAPMPDAALIAAAEERASGYLRTSTTVHKALACGCSYHRRAVLKQVRLRALRELGCPDSAVRILRQPERYYPERRAPRRSPSPPPSLADRLSLASYPGSHYGPFPIIEEDPMGPLDLGYSASSLEAESSAPAWPDLMSSASLGRESEGVEGVSAELRDACQLVSRWSSDHASESLPPSHREDQVTSHSSSKQ